MCHIAQTAAILCTLLWKYVTGRKNKTCQKQYVPTASQNITTTVCPSSRHPGTYPDSDFALVGFHWPALAAAAPPLHRLSVLCKSLPCPFLFFLDLTPVVTLLQPIDHAFQVYSNVCCQKVHLPICTSRSYNWLSDQ